MTGRCSGAGIGVERSGLEELFHEFPRFGFAVPGHLQAHPFAEEAIDILDKSSDLPQDEEGNSGVLEQALRHRQKNAIVGFQYNDEFESRVERVLRGLRGGSGQ